VAPLHFKQRQTPHLSAVMLVLMLALSAGAAVSQTAPTDAITTTPTEAGTDKEYATAIANCESMWDRDTHMTRKEWSRTCRRVQDRLKRKELR
jgi:hypothetical protein